jgi:hypothetical protein
MDGVKSMRGCLLLVVATICVTTPCLAADETGLLTIGNGTGTDVPKDDGSCRRVFDAMYVRLQSIVQDRKSSGASKRDTMAKVYADFVDSAWIAQIAAGALWEHASNAERTAYLGAFRAFLRDADVGPGKIDEKTMGSVTDLPLLGFGGEGPGNYKGELEVMAAEKPMGEMAYSLVDVAPGDCRLRDIAFGTRSMLSAEKALIGQLGATGGLSAVTQQLTQLLAASAPRLPAAGGR